MQLRKLEEKDAIKMSGWMHDPEVNQHFRFDAGAMTQEDVLHFIAAAQDTRQNMHLACVDENDEYMGTVSLKQIDKENGTAEYAISFLKSAQGNGAARFATGEILRIAFEDLELEKVYLDVLEENQHACRFYEKQGFCREGVLRSHILLHGKRRSLCLYGILKEGWQKDE